MLAETLYNLSMHAMNLGLMTASPFHSKSRKLIKGNKKTLKKLERHFVEEPGKYLWFHCASLGEFEQGRPVMERFKKEMPGYKILLTFFSPSGYEVRKDYEGADIVAYLPIDTRKNASAFINIVRPEMAVFVKYEFWLHYLQGLNSRSIPVVSISSVFRSDQLFFKKYGAFYRKFLKYFEHFFVQDATSEALLKKIGFDNVTIGGDTRFDRVSEISRQPGDFKIIEDFINGQKAMVIGSSWPEDLELLHPLFKDEGVRLKYIIAPHEVDNHQLLKIEKKLDEPVIRYTKAGNNDLSGYKYMLIDTIGMLSALYRYGDMAYVGGAFGEGLHNILEPAAFGIPVFFGKSKKNEKYLEAGEIVKAGGGFAVERSDQLIRTVKRLLKDDDARKQAGNAASQYILDNTGATETIVSYLLDKLK